MQHGFPGCGIWGKAVLTDDRFNTSPYSEVGQAGRRKAAWLRLSVEEEWETSKIIEIGGKGSDLVPETTFVTLTRFQVNSIPLNMQSACLCLGCSCL